jgi:hypothetical protein
VPAAFVTGRRQPYDPWLDLRINWPEITVVVLPMTGRLLGWVNYPVIALRASSGAAQRRCTLAHEIVHLERGISDCGPWADREERLVHAEVARRLIDVADLAAAVAELGGTHDIGGLAARLDVDTETVTVRLGLITAAERATIDHAGVRELWDVA